MGVLTQLERSLSARGMTFALAEVKGPVMGRLRTTELGQRLTGKVFMSVHEAFEHATRSGEPPVPDKEGLALVGINGSK